MLLKKLTILACVATVTPVLCQAEAAADRPTTQPARGVFARRHELPLPTDEEWKQVAEFMEQHSPYRLEQLRRIKEGTPLHNTLRSRVWVQYKQLQEQKKDDEPLYNISLKRFELKDQQFHLLQDLSAAKGDDRADLQTQLRQNAVELVGMNLQEREHRLEKLTQTVEKERQRLEQDRKNQDKLVEDQIRQAMAHEGMPRDGHRTRAAGPASNSADANAK